MHEIWGKPTYAGLDDIVGPRHTALLVIDMQNDFCDERGAWAMAGIDISAIQSIVPAVSAIVAAAREAGVLVVWLQQTLLPQAMADSPAWLRRRTRRGTIPPNWTIPGTFGHAFVDPLKPGPSEPIVVKHRSSGFVGTNLDLILRSSEIESVVVIGAATQGCVESTVRDASFHEYYVVLVPDCVATTDPQLHAASLICQGTRCDFASALEIQESWTSGAQAVAPTLSGSVRNAHQ